MIAATVVHMTATNIAECTSQLLRRGWEVETIERVFADLEITVVHEELPYGILAGELHARTGHTGLSTGDALCLAAAVRDHLAVFTADRAWDTLDLGVPIIVIR